MKVSPQPRRVRDRVANLLRACRAQLLELQWELERDDYSLESVNEVRVAEQDVAAMIRERNR